MDALFILLFLGSVAVAAPVGVYTFVVFDRILAIEHRQYRSEWESDGHPGGFFWMPREGGLGGSIVRARLLFTWMISQPSWSRSTDDIHDRFQALRWCGIAYGVSCALIVVLVLAFRWIR